MAVEDHPKFTEWKKALEDLIEVKQAFKKGHATQADVENALKAYVALADEL